MRPSVYLPVVLSAVVAIEHTAYAEPPATPLRNVAVTDSDKKSDATPDSADKKDSDGSDHKAGILLGLKGGGGFPIGGLNPTPFVGIEAGYAFPVLHRALGLAVDLDYAVPKKSGTETDPRVAGGKYTWHLTEQELGLMPVVLFRFSWFSKFVPFLGIGPRINFLESTVRSNEGTPTFEETHEKGMKVGLGVPFGAEYTVGPGGVLAEVLFQWAPVDHTATGDVHLSAFSLALGYRFLL